MMAESRWTNKRDRAVKKRENKGIRMDMMLGNDGSNNKKYVLFGIAAIILTSLFYNTTLDLLLITVLFAASYILGTAVAESLKFQIGSNVKTAIGLGIIGVLIYYILLLGVGSRSVYLLILLVIIILGRKKIISLFTDVEKYFAEKSKLDYAYLFMLLIVFIIYLTYGSAPIDKFDTLAKHLPLTLYAAETGKWYTNVVESIVYGESMVLQYTYSAVFACFGVYKALCLFNIVLFFFLFQMTTEFCQRIYENTNQYLLAAIYFTTPIFFEFSTVFYLEILPMYFIMAAVLCFSELNPHKTWANLPEISFLFGCSVFTKLTILPSVFILGLVVIILCVKYIYITKDISKSYIKILYSGIAFVLPFITSIAYIWYKTGNPVFPFFNEVFKSPYFSARNFQDPFTNSLGLNIKSFISVMFHTSRNIEMADRGLGLFLFLIVFIPIALLIYRKKQMFFWSILPFAIFQVSCLFSYNIRYLMYVILLFCSVTSISLSIVKDRLPIKKLRAIIVTCICIVIIVPNLIYIENQYNPINKIMSVDSSITKSNMRELLEKVPRGMRVVSLNSPFKGDFEGFLNPLNWQNQSALDEIESGKITIEEYVSSFDYVIYEKSLPVYSSKIEKLVVNAEKKGSVITPVYETETHILYEVAKKKEIYNVLYSKVFDVPEVSRLDSPITYRFDIKEDKYIIKEEMQSNQDMQMRYQINWYDKGDKFLNASIIVYNLDKGDHIMESVPIPAQKGASYGILYVVPHDNNDVFVKGYELLGQTKKLSYVDEKIKEFDNRELLKRLN